MRQQKMQVDKNAVHGWLQSFIEEVDDALADLLAVLNYQETQDRNQHEAEKTAHPGEDLPGGLAERRQDLRAELLGAVADELVHGVALRLQPGWQRKAAEWVALDDIGHLAGQVGSLF